MNTCRKMAGGGQFSKMICFDRSRRIMTVGFSWRGAVQGANSSDARLKAGATLKQLLQKRRF